MALTQSARIPGPSWEEEVVPALRKRLESESRTLAHRMSAISLSSVEDAPGASYTTSTEQSTRPRYEESRPQHQSSNPRIQRVPLNQPTPATTTSPRINGTSTSPTNFQRARTYSTPYASDYPDTRANGTAKPKNSASRSPDPNRSLSPRPNDAKPTRIPVPTRPPMPSQSQSHTGGGSVTPSAWSPEQSSGKQRTVVPSASSQSLEISNRGFRQPGLLNETPPFPTDTTLSSSFSQPTVASHSVSLDLADPPRASMESEERPYEHWYRGEVSRNGGVGELRVGRRQEMLDIANYGHMVRKMQDKQRLEAAAARAGAATSRKRADSIAGITNKVRQRNSSILEDENTDYHYSGQMVLDETPLTDLDGSESEAQSGVDQYIGIAYAPDEGDMEASPSQRWTTVAGAHEMARSVTPTQNTINASMVPSRSQNVPPTRIPGPSSRRNSYSQTAPTNASATTVTGNGQAQTPSPKQQPARSTPSPQALQKPRQPQSSPGTPQKRYNSPAQQKKLAAAKMAKSKTLPAKQEGDKRGSVAYYPSVDGDGEDMADAIPSWTQPVVREGNWDDVVLPVVARKKGLDGYESADGSPKPRRVNNAVEPAPGTFGFDHSKYRPPRGDGVSIPMDEFGRPHNEGDRSTDAQHDQLGVNGSDEFHEMRLNATATSAHDETPLPSRQGHSPSPAPFSDYPANTIEVRRAMQNRPEMMDAQANMASKQRQAEEEEGGSGCCKCVVM